MADRIAESGELAVDELRRKARRRLVGAIVLALVAAVVVPLVLENEPRPLGDDVAVQIPPRDESKFVNRLTGAASDGKSPKSAAARVQPDAAPVPHPPSQMPATSSSVPAPAATGSAPAGATASATAPADAGAGAKKVLADAEQRVLTPAAKSAPKTAPEGKSAPEQKASPEPKTAPEPQSAPVQKAGPEPKAPAPAAEATAKTAPAASGFVVQLAAFSDDKGANALANKLKRAGYAAFVEPVTTSRGTLWRVRVGGYSTRAEADAARVKLKDEGYSGIVTAVK